ncbi:somatostatin-1A isoform X2 [Anguilla rostrata]|uniref:somatostatin-1A isoform X2 n=1 Tax=Anguilla rostrata TaxID=7938 RepID=UPI0030CE42FB
MPAPTNASPVSQGLPRRTRIQLRRGRDEEKERGKEKRAKTQKLPKHAEKETGNAEVLLVALSASVLLAQVNGAPQRDMLAELLRTDVTEGNEDLSRMLFLKIVSDLMMTGDNKVLPDPRPRSTEELRIHQDVARQLPLSQRERKAGCRNFFWKTFTSC